MIVKFHARGKGGGSGPVDYLLGRERNREGATVLQGNPEEVDHFVADRLREEAGEILVERNVREVVFDFRKTVFMDSSGIGLVMGRFREMELIGGKVRAVHVGERMRRILVMSGVTRVIEVEEEKTWK